MSNFKGVEATPSTYVPLHIGHTITKYVVDKAGCVKLMGDHELEEKLSSYVASIMSLDSLKQKMALL